MFERMTDRSRHVITTAQDDALSRRHTYIDAAHLFIRIVAEETPVLEQIFRELGITFEAVDTALKQIIPNGTMDTFGHLPFSPDAKYVFEYAAGEIFALKHAYIIPEHLLLGTTHLLEREFSAQHVINQLFAALNINPETLRTVTLERSSEY